MATQAPNNAQLPLLYNDLQPLNSGQHGKMKLRKNSSTVMMLTPSREGDGSSLLASKAVSRPTRPVKIMWKRPSRRQRCTAGIEPSMNFCSRPGGLAEAGAAF